MPVSPQSHQNFVITINLYFLSAGGGTLLVCVFIVLNLLWCLALFLHWRWLSAFRSWGSIASGHFPSLWSSHSNGKWTCRTAAPQEASSRTLGANIGLALLSLRCYTHVMLAWQSDSAHGMLSLTQFLSSSSYIHNGFFHELKTSPASLLSVISTLNCA